MDNLTNGSFSTNHKENKNHKSPREIIAEGVRKSTQINDEKTITLLTEQALRADSGTKVKGYDSFLFNIAESLENIRCETSSQNEYFSWIDESNKILKQMNDGIVTDDELHERNHFISMSWQRETELLTCLALYEQSDNPMAKKRYNELRIKLVRLRQIRSALMTNTRSSSDQEKIKAAEQARLRHTIRTLEEMREYDEYGDYNNQALLEHMRQLQISHEKDFEFYKGYSFYTRMLEEQRRSQTERNSRENFAVLLSEMRHGNESKEDVRERIFRLTGRRLRENSEENVRRVRGNAFDANSYMKLRELRSMQNEGD